MSKELLDFFDFNKNTPSVSAFTQQRSKVLPEAFEYLFNNCKYDVFYNYVKILNLMTLAGRLSFFALLLNFRKEI